MSAEKKHGNLAGCCVTMLVGGPGLGGYLSTPATLTLRRDARGVLIQLEQGGASVLLAFAREETAAFFGQCMVDHCTPPVDGGAVAGLFSDDDKGAN